MRSLLLVLLPFVIATALLLTSACNDRNCYSTCQRIYGESPTYCGATHTSAADPREAINICTDQCQDALYDERITGDDIGTFYDEPSSVIFINCVWSQVDPASPDCAQTARNACGAAIR